MNGVKYPPFAKCLVYKPTNVESVEDDTPEYKLTLQHVYGSSRKGVNGKRLFLNSRNRLVYPAAATGVVADIGRNSQQIFVKHKDDVKAMAMHPDGTKFATGECGKDDCVYVWDSNSMSLLSEIKTYRYFKPGGVLALSFSKNGQLLAICGGDNYNSTLLVYNWKKRELIGKKKCSTKRTFSMSFNTEIENKIVWTGKNEIKFFTISSSNINDETALVSSKGGKLQSFYCVEFDKKGRALVGTKDGHIYVFKGNKLEHKKRVHQRSVFGIHRTADGFVTASKDKSIKVFKFTNNYFKLEHTVKIGFAVGSVVPISENSYFIWGRYNGRLCSVNQYSGEVKVYNQFHSGLGTRTELWGIDTFKNSAKFVTAGDDGQILVWDGDSRKLLAKTKNHHDWRAVACSPDGTQFTVADKKGNLLMYSVDSLEKSIDKSRCGTEEVAVLAYSPCGAFLAVGSHNNRIYILDVQNSYKKVATLEAHTSFITGLDWSQDSKYIQSTSGDYEMLHWNASNFSRELSPSKLRDVVWDTHTCVLGWPVRGIWDLSSPQDDGTDINACCVDLNKKLIVSVDDFGCVNLYRYPTLSNKPSSLQYIGHCSHVTRCKFSGDGNYVYTTGGGDLCVFQWKVEKNVGGGGGGEMFSYNESMLKSRRQFNKSRKEETSTGEPTSGGFFDGNHDLDCYMKMIGE